MGAAPSARVPIESFYLSNSMIETDMVLAAFSGQFDDTASDGLSNTDFYSIATDYEYTDADGVKHTLTRNVGEPFFNVHNGGTGYNMGGCMGCHGFAAVGGTASKTSPSCWPSTAPISARPPHSAAAKRTGAGHVRPRRAPWRYRSRTDRYVEDHAASATPASRALLSFAAPPSGQGVRS
jgi:hypothetical protein